MVWKLDRCLSLCFFEQQWERERNFTWSFWTCELSSYCQIRSLQKSRRGDMNTTLVCRTIFGAFHWERDLAGLALDARVFSKNSVTCATFYRDKEREISRGRFELASYLRTAKLDRFRNQGEETWTRRRCVVRFSVRFIESAISQVSH